MNDYDYLKRFTHAQITSGKTLARKIKRDLYKNPPSDLGLKGVSETGKQQLPYLYLRDLHAVLVYPRHGGWSYDCVFLDVKGESGIIGYPEQAPPLKTRQNALDAARVLLKGTYHNELNNTRECALLNDSLFSICGHIVTFIGLPEQPFMGIALTSEEANRLIKNVQDAYYENGCSLEQLPPDALISCMVLRRNGYQWVPKDLAREVQNATVH